MARFVFAVGLFVLALPAAAATRSRAVATLPNVMISGVVRDAVTGSPIAGALVRSGTHQCLHATGEDGKYTLTLPGGRPAILTAEQFAYLSSVAVVTPVQGLTFDFALNQKPMVTIKLTSGSTAVVPLDSLKFGYYVLFIGTEASDRVNLCKPAGSSFVPSKDEMAKITGPITPVSFSPCCDRGTILTANLELKTGEKTAVYFNDTCYGEDDFIFGRDRSTGATVSVNFADIAEVDFP